MNRWQHSLPCLMSCCMSAWWFLWALVLDRCRATQLSTAKACTYCALCTANRR